MSSFPPNPRVAWVGVGAVGLLYSASLARAGVETHLLLRSDYDAAVRDGITVRSIKGDFHVPPSALHCHRSPASLPPPDLLVITAKTTANPDLPPLLAPLVAPHTLLLTLQNGFGNEQFLSRHFGDDRVLGGTAFVSVHRIAPATADHQNSGRIALGRHAGPPDDRTRAVVELFKRSGFPIDLLPSLKVGRWEKQLWNIPFNGLGAALLADTSILLKSETGRNLVRAIMQEVVALARADGVSETDLPDSLIETKIHYTLKMGAYRTSMQLDREAGRAMEIDSIISSVLDLSDRSGVPAPLIRTLQAQLNTVEVNRVSHP